ncbi:MAG: hypothetical protein AB1659_11315 [Thermodesulfobacteriota bacterium]
MSDGQTEDRFLKKIPLKNGLSLEFFDASRKLAGDRWRVTLIAVIHIPVREIWNARNIAGILLSDLLAVIGEEAIYQKKMERNFIDEKEKDSVLASMEDSLSSSQLSYLSHGEFPIRFILKTYRDLFQKKTWYPGVSPDKD